MVVCSNLLIRPASGWTAAISLLPVFNKTPPKTLLRRQINGKYRKCLLKEAGQRGHKSH
jgi:hypothetical protein